MTPKTALAYARVVINEYYYYYNKIPHVSNHILWHYTLQYQNAVFLGLQFM